MPSYEELADHLDDKPTASNPYLNLLNEQERVQRGQTVLNVADSVTQNPDRAAENLVLAKRYGTIPAVVDAYPEDFRRRVSIEETRKTLEQSPKLQTYLAGNPNAIPIAHDDIPNLAKIESLAGKEKDWVEASKKGGFSWEEAAKGLGGAYNKAAGSLNLVLGAFPAIYSKMTGNTDASDWWFKNMVDPSQNRQARYSPNADATFTEKATNMAGNLVGVLSQITLSGTTGAEVSGAANAAPTAANVAANMVEHGSKAMLFPAIVDAVDMGHKVYAETGDAQAAIKAAQAQYVSSTAMGVMPMSAPGKLGMRMATGAASGAVVGDLNTQLMNWALPSKMQSEYTFEDMLLQSLAGGVLGVGGPRSPSVIHDAVRKTYTEAVQAESAREDIGNVVEMAQAAANSKVRSRAPEIFRKFIADNTDGTSKEDVYIDGTVFKQELDKVGVRMETIERELPELAKQVTEALQSQGTVRIPTADYLTHVGNEKSPVGEVFAQLMPEVKLDPLGMTKNESEHFYQHAAEQLQAEAASHAKEVEAAKPWADSVKVMQDRMVDELNATQRFQPEVSKVNAAIRGAIFEHLAREDGILPHEAHEKYAAAVTDGMMRKGASFDQSIEKNLLVQHNLSEENLLHAHKMGGLPVPSLAVTKAENPLHKFGEITLIGDEALADPKGYAKTKVFGADIYSPRYPEVSHKLNKDALSKLNEILKPYRTEKDREIYGGDVSSVRDLSENKAFREYAKEKSGNPVGADWAQTKKIAADLLNEVGSEERIFKGFDNNGNRRYIAHTLDNVIKELKSQLRGGEGTNYGVGSIRSAFTPEFKSVKQIRDAKDRLLNSDGFDKVKEEIDNDFLKLAEDLQSFHPASKGFGFLDTVSSTFYDAAKMGIPRALKENGFSEVSPEKQKDIANFLNKLRSLPTQYFEAKILRAVDISEFKGAVVPHDISQDALDALAKRGVTRIEKYKDEAERTEKINKFNDLFFQDARGFFAPNDKIIGILKDADLSTFLHETGHEALQLYTDIAARADAPQSIKEDTAKLLNYLGVESLEKWHSLSVEEQRPHHEQLARSFEQYFMEGKAPSLELRGVFARIKQWMIHIYKTLGALNVQLTPEVRGVFDRMLASEDAIKEAESTRGYFDALKEKPAEMSDSAWADYKALGQEATQDAIEAMQARSIRDMKWVSNAKSKAMRDLQKTADEQRREVRIDARREILSQPIYQAWSFLTRKDPEAYKAYQETSGKTLDSSFDSMLDAVAKMGGVDRAEVKATWGTDHKDIPGKVVKKSGGRSIDEMAELLGERGYLPRDANGKVDLRDFEEKFSQELSGDKQYSDHAEYDRIYPRELQAGELVEYPAGKLDIGMLRGLTKQLGPEAIARLEKLGMAEEKGIDIDLVADRFGYESALGLIHDLASAEVPQRAIEGLTDRYMIERHAELATPRAISDAANELIHNDARAKFMATGLKILAKAPVPVRQLVKGAKEAAEAAIGAKRVRDVKPRQYEAAEARANKNVLALAGKDPQGAVMAQRSALLNNQLVKSATEALKEIEKSVDYFKRLEKNPAQSKMRGEFLDQMNSLLGRFDLRTSVTNPAKDRVPLKEWIEETTDSLSAVTPDLPDWVLNEGYRTHYSELTVDQFRGLSDAVKQLEHLARREQHQYMAIRAMEFAQERGEVLGEIRKVWSKAFDEEGLPKEIEADFVPSLKKTTQRLGDKFAGEFLNPETILSILGGGKFTVINESLFGRMSHRSDWKAQRLEGLYKELKPLFEKYNLQDKYDFARKDIGTPTTGIALTRENAVVVALLHGNADGRERLKNYGWGEEKQQAIINLLEGRDLDLIEGIHKVFDENLWPELEALNKRTRGKAPPKVEATPYQVNGREMQGGYFKLKYDTALDERAHRLDEGQAVKELLGGGMGMSAKTNQGSSTERKQNVILRPRLDLGVFAEAVNESVHDLAYRESVADTMRLLNNKGIMLAVKQVVGVEGYRSLVERVREVAAPPRNPSGYIEKTLSIARRNTVINLMSGVKTALQNFTGLAPALAELNAGSLGSEVAKFYGPKMMERYDFCMSQSDYMRRRFTSYDRDLQNDVKKLTVNGSFRPDESTFLALMGFIDKGVSVPVWNAAFKKGMESFENDTKKAVDYADHVVRQTQGSGRDVDLASIMSGHGGWGQLKKAFTMFYSYFNGQLNLLVKHGVISKLEAQEHPQLAAANFAAKFIAIIAVPTILTEILMNGAVQDDEDVGDLLKRYTGAFAKYGAGMFPLVRDLAPGALSVMGLNDHYFGTKLSPLDSAAEGMVKGAKSLKDVAQGEGDEKDTKNLIMALGYGFGLPGKLVSDTVEGTRQFLNGDAGPQAIVLGPPKKQ